MNKNISASDIFVRAKEELQLGVRHNHLYFKKSDSWTALSNSDLAVEIRKLYPDSSQKDISTGAVKEAIERLLQDPSLQLHFVEEEHENYLNLREHVFNVQTARPVQTPGDFGYILDFKYIEKSHRKMPVFDDYLASTFPTDTATKRQLLLQIMGYVLSDYSRAKAGFFFIGESDSGKSTILELIQHILPEHSVTTIPLYRLSNRFNLARLADSRVNICTELDPKSFSSTDIFKQLTSCERVTAEHKGCKPFDFRLKCKSLNASNMLPELHHGDGLSAMLNRMIILIFPVSIPKENQNPELLYGLWEERNSIFSDATDSLIELFKNNFRFAEPADSLALKKQLLSQGKALENFLHDRCLFNDDAREHLVTLYEDFNEYCKDNLLEMQYTKSAFSQYLSQQPQLRHGKFRINGSPPLSGVYGIRIKTEGEYRRQDSETYSQTTSGSKNHRNTGTLEHTHKEELPYAMQKNER